MQPATTGAPANDAQARPAGARGVTHTTAGSAEAVRAGRLPVSVLVAAVLTGLTAAFGAYGAIYFTGLEGWDLAGATFVVTYEFISLCGLVAAVAFARGHYLGRIGVIVYAIWMLYFTAFKVAVVHEWEAIPFGVVAAVALLAATRPTSRNHAR